MTPNKKILLLLIPLVTAALTLPIGISLSFMHLENRIYHGIGMVALVVGVGSLVFLVLDFVYLKRYKLKFSEPPKEAHAYGQRRKSSADKLTCIDETDVPMLSMKPQTGIVGDRSSDPKDFEPLPVFKLQPVPPGKKKNRTKTEKTQEDQDKELETLLKEPSKPVKEQSNNNNYVKICGVGNWKHIDNVKRLSQEGGYDSRKGWVHRNNVTSERRPQKSSRSDWIYVDNVNYKRICQVKRVATYTGDDRKKREARVKYNRSESV